MSTLQIPRDERRVDLNADLGEEITDDVALMGVVTSANVACGFHAGSAAIMRQVCGLAASNAVVVGAQVSYADRAGFGRVDMDVSVRVLTQQVADQVGLLEQIAAEEGVEVGYLKPHGALYHRTRVDPEQAGAVLAGSGHLPVLGMPGHLLSGARDANRRVVSEGFPDRGYRDSDTLKSRGEPGALLVDPSEIAAAALTLAPKVESLCLHGDTPGAVRHAGAVREALLADHWRVTAFLDPHDVRRDPP